MNNKTLVIIGTTSSGKTDLAVKAALRYDGEVVSADSRQVYVGMDIGTGKDLCEYDVTVKGKKVHVPYHLIDVAKPMEVFSLADFQRLAIKVIDDILKRDKLPIIAGGTGMYVQCLVDAYDLSAVKPDQAFRKELEGMTIRELNALLESFNKKFARQLNNSDRNNKRRLARYVELAKTEKLDLKVDSKNKTLQGRYNHKIIGLKCPGEVLHARIYKRIKDRLEKEHMIEEVEDLYRNGVTWERFESLGLEYRFISRYLRDMLDYEEMIVQLYTASKKFAKQQMKWYKRWEKQGAKIHWFEGKSDEIWDLCDEFLKIR
ncbi:MAG: tRNA (adenosine(37)-N6)-dimethylallyltransferase MiaA [Patescibacteria group bacterium]|nr:tRNA (adenosine(37)-N6)-dimethylallyltransferase MiaA [Patescibacteria group bacterium]